MLKSKTQDDLILKCDTQEKTQIGSLLPLSPR